MKVFHMTDVLMLAAPLGVTVFGAWYLFQRILEGRFRVVPTLALLATALLGVLSVLGMLIGQSHLNTDESEAVYALCVTAFHWFWPSLILLGGSLLRRPRLHNVDLLVFAVALIGVGIFRTRALID